MCTAAINSIATPMVVLLRQLTGLQVEDKEKTFETTNTQKAFKVFLYNLDLINLLRNEVNEKAVDSIKTIVSLSLSTLIDVSNKPGSGIGKTSMDEITNQSYLQAVEILNEKQIYSLKNDLVIVRGIIGE